MDIQMGLLTRLLAACVLLALCWEPGASVAATSDVAATAVVESTGGDPTLASGSGGWATFDSSVQNLNPRVQQQQVDQQQWQQQLQRGGELSRKMLRGGEQEEDLYSTVNALNLAGIKQHTYAFGKGEPIRHKWRCIEGCDRK